MADKKNDPMDEAEKAAIQAEAKRDVAARGSGRRSGLRRYLTAAERRVFAREERGEPAHDEERQAPQ
ncbi:hypothetical protein [Amycolatopsis sp. CA-230715]|uniref:hypothetical protein n=1 Tax=Amycolatopsis sp. CA-230715 TaxID=2745196 RepID=UPI001C02C94D|nr:hypothetical protein [Amycolatopsis sp. CA-230715]QWF77999.1 hypothetical protein HUW46_01392 [Amycolatopsis sp. CA-230715]